MTTSQPKSVQPKTPASDSSLDLLNWKQVSLVCGAAMAMLYCAFEPVGFWPLAWIAPAVWACGVVFARSTKTAVLIGWGSWVVFWFASIWWLMLPTGVGYILGAGYQAATGLVLAWAVRKTARGGFPMWVALPLVWCAMELFRSAGPLPFEWYFLAHSQWQQTVLIQIVEFTGPLGLSFVVAMGSGLLVDWARVKFAAWPKKPVIISTVVVVFLLLGVLGLGAWLHLGSEMDEMFADETYGTSEVKIGVVQEVFPLSLAERPAAPSKYLDRHITSTLDLLKERPDVVCWPETMLPSGLNREAVLFNPFNASEADLRCFAKRMGRVGTMPIEEIRAAVAPRVGLLTMTEYRAAATRILIYRYLTDEQFEVLGHGVASQLYYWAGCSMEAFENVKDPANYERFKLVRAALSKFRPEAVRMDEHAQRKIRLDINRVFGCLRGQAALMQALAVAMDCPILAGGSTWKRNPTPLDDEDLWVYHNGVVEFTPAGDWGWDYAKRQLVPFSEYVPGKYSATSLWRWMRKAIPAVMVQIEPGRNDTPYLLRNKLFRRQGVEIHTPICFEGTFARRVREMVLAGKSGSQKILINLSNDGWFVYTARPGSPQQTPEHRLHFAHSVFRAVETRTPVVRVVNTGISGWIDSTGRVRKTMEKPGRSGRNDTIAPQSEVYHVMPGGHETTLYLRCGEWFAVAVVGGCGLLALITLLRSRNKRNPL